MVVVVGGKTAKLELYLFLMCVCVPQNVTTGWVWCLIGYVNYISQTSPTTLTDKLCTL